MVRCRLAQTGVRRPSGHLARHVHRRRFHMVGRLPRWPGMNIGAYLRRIGLPGPLPPTLETLRRVHAAHLRAIPYENIDVQLGRPVTIERAAIFDKIVNRRRGGWCYEMNGLLGWALGELGFKVTRATGAVMREMFGQATEANHLVLRVE